MIGIRLNWPVLQAVIGVIGMMVPSSIGPVTYGPVTFGVPWSCRISAADSARRHAAAPGEASVGQPAAVANAMPRANPIDRMGIPDKGERSQTARLNSPA